MKSGDLEGATRTTDATASSTVDTYSSHRRSDIAEKPHRGCRGHGKMRSTEAILVVALAAMAACYIPARRVFRIQPAQSLRQE